jgi:hypothetical protein
MSLRLGALVLTWDCGASVPILKVVNAAQRNLRELFHELVGYAPLLLAPSSAEVCGLFAAECSIIV